MRKIGAHYIYLPGFDLLKNGFVEINEFGMTMHAHDVNLQEIAALEFHAGMLVTADAARHIATMQHPCDIVYTLQKFYALHSEINGFATLGGLDYMRLMTTNAMIINYFR